MGLYPKVFSAGGQQRLPGAGQRRDQRSRGVLHQTIRHRRGIRHRRYRLQQDRTYNGAGQTLVGASERPCKTISNVLKPLTLV